jgi:hypothetical protein
MARIRTIKPEFFTSEDIVSLTPMARLFYVALWCEADREGRLEWKPRTFKIRYFPADDCDVDALAREVIALGLVKQYGQGLAYIPSFTKHQFVNNRESASVLPDPKEGKEGEGKEGEGSRAKDTSPRVAHASRFTPPTVEEVDQYAIEAGIELDASKLVDFYTSKGWKIGKDTMKDWKAAARNWARRDCGGKPSGTEVYR